MPLLSVCIDRIEGILCKQKVFIVCSDTCRLHLNDLCIVCTVTLSLHQLGILFITRNSSSPDPLLHTAGTVPSCHARPAGSCMCAHPILSCKAQAGSCMELAPNLDVMQGQLGPACQGLQQPCEATYPGLTHFTLKAMGRATMPSVQAICVSCMPSSRRVYMLLMSCKAAAGSVSTCSDRHQG